MFGQNDNNQLGSVPASGQPQSSDVNGQIPQAVPAIEPVQAPSIFSSSPVTPPSPVHDSAKSPQSSSDDLIDIKQKALHDLSPLVKHLDQDPTDKFKTTMMMIQASDDQTLIPIAYESANKIVNEKEKAQALLDIVNEINYFTNKTSA